MRLILLLVSLLSLISPIGLSGQTPLILPPPDREIALYEGTPPGSEKWRWEERTFTTRRGNGVTQNVTRPVLQYYAPELAHATGTAVIVAPGGSFTNLMIDYEGMDIVRQLNAMGIAAFLLKYRLIYVDPAAATAPRMDDSGEVLDGPQKGENIAELATADAQRAIRWLRTHAAEFNVKPHQIGMIGFSAGGVVMMGAVKGPAETRPDFAAAIYGPGFADQQPGADAPPLFLAAATDDDWAREDSLRLYASWQKAKRPVELHLFQSGGHGFLNKGGGADHFVDRFEDWMRANHYLPPQA